MSAIIPYLNFDGNCREAMTFYKTCLGGQLELVPFGDMPGSPEALKDRIMHSRVASGAAVLMASDSMPGTPLQQGNSVWVSLHPDTLEETMSVWAGLSQGATIQQELMDAPWGAKYGMLIDKFGVQWAFNYEYPKK